MCVLHGIGHESKAPNPNTSKYGVGIGGTFIEIMKLIQITILLVLTVKELQEEQPSSGSSERVNKPSESASAQRVLAHYVCSGCRGASICHRAFHRKATVS